MVTVGTSANPADQSRPDQLADLDERLISARLALGGEFDDRIKELKAERAKLEKLLPRAGDLDARETRLVEREQECSRAMAEAQELKQKLIERIALATAPI